MRRGHCIDPPHQLLSLSLSIALRATTHMSTGATAAGREGGVGVGTMQQPPPSQLVTTLSKNRPGQGVKFKPGQTVDIPHNLGRTPNGFNIAKVITNTNQASSAPAAVPNLQVVEVPGPLGQKIMRLRYIPPKDSNGNEILDPVSLHLEIL